jgi:hypothetical protein
MRWIAQEARTPAHDATAAVRRSLSIGREAGRLSVPPNSSCPLDAPSTIHHGARPCRYTPPRQVAATKRTIIRPRRRRCTPLAATAGAPPVTVRRAAGNVTSVRMQVVVGGSGTCALAVAGARPVPQLTGLSFGSPPVVTNQCPVTD